MSRTCRCSHGIEDEHFLVEGEYWNCKVSRCDCEKAKDVVEFEAMHRQYGVKPPKRKERI